MSVIESSIRVAFAERTTAMVEHDAAIREHNAAIAEHNSAMAEHNGAVRALNAAISACDRAVAAHAQAVEEYEKAMASHRAAVEDRKRAVEERKIAVAALQSITESARERMGCGPPVLAQVQTNATPTAEQRTKAKLQPVVVDNVLAGSIMHDTFRSSDLLLLAGPGLCPAWYPGDINTPAPNPAVAFPDSASFLSAWLGYARVRLAHDPAGVVAPALQRYTTDLFEVVARYPWEDVLHLHFTLTRPLMGTGKFEPARWEETVQIIRAALRLSAQF